jgi:acylphosphatase
MNARESADQGDDPVRRAFVVRGRVQGVGFRWSTAQRARELGLEGAVWNRRDGAVEVHVRGSRPDVTAFAGWLSEGPPAARVAGVEVIEPGPSADVRGFQIRRVG